MKNLILVTALVLSGCSSSPQINGVKYEKDQVLSTSGDQSEPQWAEDGETKPFIFKDSKFYSVGIATIPGSDRPEAGLRIAENNSRAALAKNISNKLEFIFQNAEQGTGYESEAKFIGSEFTSLTTSSIQLEGHFWKRIAQVQEDGSKRIFYKLYALSSMSEPEMKSAIYKAIHDGENQHKISDGFRKQVDKQWDNLTSTADSKAMAQPSN
jgi:hypothetical protein